MARYFTLAQAEKMLPEVERLLQDAVFHKSEYQTAHDEWESVTDRIRSSGGAQIDPAAMRSLRTRRDQSVTALKQALEDIEETGALVKDLDTGLIDFLTLYQNRPVCLCWKLGETGIHFWHGEEEGLRGRKAIDDEFLAQHRGDAAN